MFEAAEKIVSLRTKVIGLITVMSNLGPNDRVFAKSLCDAFEAKGALSEKQVFWVGKLTERGSAPKAADAASPVVDGAWESFLTVVNPAATNPAIALSFDIDGKKIALRLTKAVSAKGEYLKMETAATAAPKAHDWKYTGAVLPSGAIKPMKSVANPDMVASIVASLTAFTKAPMDALIAFGHATGICGCCGKVLTHPASVLVGIGPTCCKNLGIYSQWAAAAKVAGIAV